ncbi:hypothetical protein [Thalassobaculum sp.]|uniref:hypothetical protein n=1 Tax=Thalassobaculum sp. TaxID=2022740 RepID=UPI0032EDF499
MDRTMPWPKALIISAVIIAAAIVWAGMSMSIRPLSGDGTAAYQGFGPLARVCYPDNSGPDTALICSWWR